MVKDAISEAQLSKMKRERLLFLLSGILLIWFSGIMVVILNSNQFLDVAGVLIFISCGLILRGYYLWTKIKNRHWAFMFLGFLAFPIGLIVLWKLKDKNTFSAQNTSQELLSSPNNDKST